MKTIYRAAWVAFGFAALLNFSGAARAADVVPVATAAVAAAPAGAVAATVNGAPILRADVERIVESQKKRDPSLSTGTDQAKSTLQTIRDNVTTSLIDRKLLGQETDKQKIKPAAADVDKAMLEFKKGFKDDAAMQSWLKDAGKTQADLRQLLGEQLAIDELQQRWVGDITVTPAEIQQNYKDNPKDFMAPERRTAHHILLMFKPGASPEEQQKATPAEQASALARAQNVLKLVQAKGADFEKIAAQYSEDPSAKQNAGDLGEFTAEQMVPEFSDIAFKTPAGKIVGPIKTQFGYHIIRVDSVIPSKLVPLDTRVTELVRAVLLDGKQQARLVQKMAELRSAATIKKL